MTIQTQDLDVRQEVSLLEAGKAANGLDMIGLGIAVGYSGAALSATITVAEEGQSLGVHTAWTSTFQESKVDFPTVHDSTITDRPTCEHRVDRFSFWKASPGE